MIITKNIVTLCNTNNITIDELIYLYTIHIEDDWEQTISPASIYKLQRLRFLNQGLPLTVTALGESLLGETQVENLPKTIREESRFEEFWNAFPRDDEHHMFSKTRAIRTNKAMTQVAYNKVLREGVAQQTLIDAVTKEVIYRKSFTNENYLKYMKSPTNWLIDKIYLDSDNFNIEDGLDNEGYGKEVI